MIEVLFGAGEAESMRCVKSEVVCLAYMLDIGDIRKPPDSAYRQEWMLGMRCFGEGKKGFGEELCRQQEYPRLKELLAGGAAARIWYSNAPYAYCGLCWLCHELGKMRTKAEVFTVALPEYELRAGYIARHSSLGEVAAEEFGNYLPRQKKLTVLEQQMYAMEWAKAVEKNSPLRAVVNGRLLSVPEDFYDFLIWDRLTGQPQKEAAIIGDILGSAQIAVADWWYAYRIRRLTEAGRIQIAQDCGQEYGRMIYAKAL